MIPLQTDARTAQCVEACNKHGFRTNAERIRKFMCALREELIRAHTENPEDYAWKIESIDAVLAIYPRALMIGAVGLATPAMIATLKKLGIGKRRKDFNEWMRVPAHAFVALVDANKQYVGTALLLGDNNRSDVAFGIYFDWDAPFDPKAAEPWKDIRARAEQIVKEHNE